MVGLDDIGITLTLAAFFGVPAYLVYRVIFGHKGPRGALVCIHCGGDGHTLRGVCSDCEGKGWRFP
jgi:hypothetical protein